MIDLPAGFYTTAWIVLGSVVAVVFTVVEGAALLDRDEGDTLTEHLRPIIRRHPVLTSGFAASLLWLAYHFLIDR